MDTVSVIGGRGGYRHYPCLRRETRPHTRTRTGACGHLPEPFAGGVLGWPECTGRTRCKRRLFLHVDRGRFLRNAEDGNSEVSRFGKGGFLYPPLPPRYVSCGILELRSLKRPRILLAAIVWTAFPSVAAVFQNGSSYPVNLNGAKRNERD